MNVFIDRNEYYRNWRKRSRRYILLANAKFRSKRDGLPFNLTLADIPEVPKLCPILKIVLNTHEGMSGWHDDSPSLDRIHNSKGYVKGNVRIISNRANRIKCDASIDELEKILVDARLHRY